MTPVHSVVPHRSGMPGIEALTLFTDHAFPRHTHDHYGIGIMTAGAQKSWSVVGHVESQAGDVIMVNPGEMHDGRPLDRTPRGWRIMYLDPAVVARELAGEAIEGEVIVSPVVRDATLARRVRRLFAHIERGVVDRLAAEENLLSCLMTVARRHRVNRPPSATTSAPVAAARAFLDRSPEAATSLGELAALAGVSRFQLLRGFAREVGLTPHAYCLQRRAGRARRHLAEGKSLVDAAALAGFADQSHMTRTFVRYFGVTPGRYQASLS